MTSETALQVALIVIAIATVALIASEVRTNLLRERARDLVAAAEEPDVVTGDAPFADVLTPPDEPSAPRKGRR